MTICWSPKIGKGEKRIILIYVVLTEHLDVASVAIHNLAVGQCCSHVFAIIPVVVNYLDMEFIMKAFRESRAMRLPPIMRAFLITRFFLPQRSRTICI